MLDARSTLLCEVLKLHYRYEAVFFLYTNSYWSLINDDARVGWLTTFGWQATLASSAFLVATSLQGALILSRPSYSPEAWHGTLLMIGVIVFSIVINIVGGRMLPKFEGFILVLHILGFFCVLIPLVYLSEHTSAHDVFTQFLNTGNWPTQSLSFFVGLIGMGFSFLGGDAAVHVS